MSNTSAKRRDKARGVPVLDLFDRISLSKHRLDHINIFWTVTDTVPDIMIRFAPPRGGRYMKLAVKVATTLGKD